MHFWVDKKQIIGVYMFPWVGVWVSGYGCVFVYELLLVARWLCLG